MGTGLTSSDYCLMLDALSWPWVLAALGLLLCSTAVYLWLAYLDHGPWLDYLVTGACMVVDFTCLVYLFTALFVAGSYYRWP
jgi:hypothetical protein